MLRQYVCSHHSLPCPHLSCQFTGEQTILVYNYEILRVESRRKQKTEQKAGIVTFAGNTKAVSK